MPKLVIIGCINMGRYIDLSSVIDFEPLTDDVLRLIEDDDLIWEINRRADKDFIKKMLLELDEESFDLIKEALNEIN